MTCFSAFFIRKYHTRTHTYRHTHIRHWHRRNVGKERRRVLKRDWKRTGTQLLLNSWSNESVRRSQLKQKLPTLSVFFSFVSSQSRLISKEKRKRPLLSWFNPREFENQETEETRTRKEREREKKETEHLFFFSNQPGNVHLSEPRTSTMSTSGSVEDVATIVTRLSKVTFLSCSSSNEKQFACYCKSDGLGSEG